MATIGTLVVMVTDRATGTLDSLEIREAGQHGIAISGNANPLLRRVSVVGCRGHGIVVVDSGRGQIDGAEDRGRQPLPHRRQRMGGPRS